MLPVRKCRELEKYVEACTKENKKKANMDKENAETKQRTLDEIATIVAKGTPNVCTTSELAQFVENATRVAKNHIWHVWLRFQESIPKRRKLSTCRNRY